MKIFQPYRFHYRLLLSLLRFLIALGRFEWRLLRSFLLILAWPFLTLYRLVFNFKALIAALSYDLGSFVEKLGARRKDKLLTKLAHKVEVRRARQNYWQVLAANPRQTLLKPAFTFAVLVLLIVIPIKFYDTLRFFKQLELRITNFAEAAVGQINQGKKAALATDFSSASHNFSKASEDFVSAGQALSGVDGLLMQLLKIVPNNKLKLAANGPKLVLAGQLGSALASDLSEAASALLTDHDHKNLSQVLTAFSVPGERALTKLEQLQPVLAEIDSEALPSEYQAAFLALEAKSELMSSSLRELLHLTEQLQIFLGRDIDKRYLLVFQNNTEARATGGFMGSFAIVDFKQGQIKKLQSPGGGTYDTEGGLRRLVTAPEPMWLVNPLWHMWDANWWPDWRTSAQKVMWFYEKSDGSTVDGVISLTPNVVINLLKITGPLDMTAEHGVIITADNFLDTVQAIAEQKPDVTREPKQIIGDMLSTLMERLGTLQHQDYLEIVKILESSLNQKDILLYLTDEQLQSKISELGWDGRLKDTSGDYLSVINTNIAGGKSDKKIVQTITHEANVSADGSIFNTVTILRDHQAIKREAFSGVRNVNWIRVYVPLGSRLISSSGWLAPDVAIEQPDPTWDLDSDLANESNADRDPLTNTLIYREQNKTVFANWSMVDPGQMAVIKLVYKLPFKLMPTNPQEQESLYKYTLLVQKQAGAHNSEISSNLLLPAKFKAAWQYPEQNATSFYQQDIDRSWAYLISSK